VPALRESPMMRTRTTSAWDFGAIVRARLSIGTAVQCDGWTATQEVAVSDDNAAWSIWYPAGRVLSGRYHKARVTVWPVHPWTYAESSELITQPVLSALVIDDDGTEHVLTQERVTNGTFDRNIAGWADVSTGGGSIAWDAAGRIALVAGGGEAMATQGIVTVPGETCRATWAVPVEWADSALMIGTTPGAGDGFTTGGVASGSQEFVAAAWTTYVTLWSGGNGVKFDTVSVRAAA
jgi:hypothetical protein